MRAAWTAGHGLRIRDIAVPEPPRGWALVQVAQAGICGTDLALAGGLYGFNGIPGHEFVGRVVRGPRPWRQRRVVADINVACGRCRECRRGERGHCRARRVLGIRGLNGAFAEYLCMPVRNLREVPSGLDDDAAVFAEPLAAALDARATLGSPDGAVLVVGPGRLGQLVVRVLLQEGFQVNCLGRGACSLARLPATVEAAAGLPASWVGRFAAVVECSGTAAGARSALEATRPRGALVLKSTCPGDTVLDLSRAVVDELRLVGSRCGDLSDALRWLARGRIDPRGLITRTAPLDLAPSALRDAAHPSHLKVVLRP